MCHLSPVTCHMSPLTCHLSPMACCVLCVTCHMSLMTTATDPTSASSPSILCTVRWHLRPTNLVFFQAAILDHFWAKNIKFQTIFLFKLLSKNLFVIFFPRTFVNGSNKTFRKYAFGGDRQTNRQINNDHCDRACLRSN